MARDNGSHSETMNATPLVTGVSALRVRDLLGRTRLDLQGVDDGTILRDALLQHPADAVVALDLRGLEYLGYSHAKGSLREMLLQRSAGALGARRVHLVAEQGPEFLDGLSDALQQVGMLCLVTRAPGALDSAFLIGEVSKNVAELFELVRLHGAMAPDVLAARLGQSVEETLARVELLVDMGVLSPEREAGEITRVRIL